MKKPLILYLLILISSLGLLAQEKQTSGLGKVIDKKGTPIANAHILKKNTRIGVSTNKNGVFSSQLFRIGDTLIVSHLSYVKQEFVLTQRNISITLQANKNLLPEANVFAKKESVRMVNNPWVIDYYVVNDSTLLIAKVGNKGSVIQIKSASYSSRDFLFKGLDKISTNCLHNIYLCTEDTAYQIEIINREPIITSFLTIEELNQMQRSCSIFEKQRQYFFNYKANNKLIEFFCINDKSKNPILFHKVFDAKSLKYVRDLSLTYHSFRGVASLMGDIHPDSPDPNKTPKRVRKKVDLGLFIRFLSKIKIESPIFIKGNNVFIVDNINDELVFFNALNLVEQKIKFTPPFKKAKIKHIVQDKVTELVYYFVKENDKMNVYRLDIDTGVFTSMTSLRPFIEKPTIYNGVLYYLDYNFRNETRELYKLPL